MLTCFLQWCRYSGNNRCCTYLLVRNRRNTCADVQKQALSNASVTDFLILEYNSVIGGRVAHTTFGAKNNSYTVELGANWVCQTGKRIGMAGLQDRLIIGSGHFHTWGSGQSNMDIGMLSAPVRDCLNLTKNIGRTFKLNEHVSLVLQRLLRLKLMFQDIPTIPQLRPSTRTVL